MKEVTVVLVEPSAPPLNDIPKIIYINPKSIIVIKKHKSKWNKIIEKIKNIVKLRK